MMGRDEILVRVVCCDRQCLGVGAAFTDPDGVSLATAIEPYAVGTTTLR